MEYKRQSRHPSDETRARISKSLTGVAKSAEHKQHIQQGMQNYWRNDGNFPDDRKDKTTARDLVL